MTYLEHQLDYSRLKRDIKVNFKPDQEAAFRAALDDEISRVFGYIDQRHVKVASRVEESRLSRREREDSLGDEIYELSEFIRRTLRDIRRLVRRHDKYTGYTLAEAYEKVIMEKRLQMAGLRRLAGERGRGEDGRRTYLVPGECLVGLKMGLMGELRMEEGECENEICLDGDGYEVYRGRLKGEDEALVRVRWSGSQAAEGVVEVVRGDEVEVSVRMSKEEVEDFIQTGILSRFSGRAAMANKVNKAIKADRADTRSKADKTGGKTDKASKTTKANKTISRLIKQYNLKPSLRIFYKPCFFKGKGIEAKLHSNVVFIKGSTDLKGEEWPFRHAPPGDIERFSMSILEVSGSAPWLEEALSDARVQLAPGFSSFIHGCAALHPDAAQRLPQWVTGDAVRRESDLLLAESDVSYDTSPLSETRIAIPVRVEPKAFFANERTFLSWVQFAVFLGGVGTAMVSLGDAHAYLCGVMLVGVAGMFAFYALYLFHSRALKIRVKDAGPYDDTVGPMVLIGIFVFVMALSFVFKFPIKKTGLKS